jgi:hypothetical protein
MRKSVDTRKAWQDGLCEELALQCVKASQMKNYFPGGGACRE